MQGKYHFACGIAGGAILAATFYQYFESPILDSATVVIGSCLGSLIPDIDSPTSAIGTIVKPISKLINKAFGHRTITHSGLWLIPLILMLSKMPSGLLFGYIGGYFGHLLSDTLTKGGVPWFYPLKSKRYKLSRIRSGDGDGVLTVLSLVIMLSLNIAVRYLIDNQIG